MIEAGGTVHICGKITQKIEWCTIVTIVLILTSASCGWSSLCLPSPMAPTSLRFGTGADVPLRVPKTSSFVRGCLFSASGIVLGACEPCKSTRPTLSLYEKIDFGQVPPGDWGCGAQID